MNWRKEIIEQARDRGIAELVVCSINKLFDRDRDLFEVDANERSITHRLGIYIQENLPDWDVDCEYNRDGHETKYLTDKIGKTEPDDIHGKTVFPDIIVHKRKTNKNKLILEVKKANNPQPNCIDLEKLACLSKQLNYESALFLRMQTGTNIEAGITEFRWVNG